MSDCLPQEILSDVFLRLPNKDLGMCMCVSKDWLSLIKDPSFVSSHLDRTISSKKDPLFLLRTRSKEELEVQYSLHIDDEKFSEYRQVVAPSHDLSFFLIGSCNGLVCFMHNLYTSNNTFLLWNPLIRKSVALPKPNVTFETHGPFEAFAGFGFDSRTNDYKVLRIVRLLDAQSEDEDEDDGVVVAVEVEIFSLNRNSWENITHKSPQYDIVERGSQAFVNEAVHWIATQRSKNGEFRNLVLALDMGTEQFREIMLPECLTDEDPKYLSVSVYKDSSIAVSRRKYFGFSDGEIWVLKAYGLAESWKKLLVFGRLDGGVPRALGFRGNGAVVFQLHDGDMISVHPEGLDVKDLGVQGASGYSFVDSFVESLALLDKPMAAKDGCCQVTNFLE